MILKAVIIVVSILVIILASFVVGGAIIVGQILENDPNIRNEIRQRLGAGEEFGQDLQEEALSSPGMEEVKVGDTVTWINNDSSPHTAATTSSNDDTITFDSDILRRDETFSFTFGKEGEYLYFCTIHPSMVGTTVVLPS